MDAASVGRKISELRRQKGMTQKELAALLHVTDKAVSKWERGINFPEITQLEPLSAALGTTVIQLLSLEEATGPEVAQTLQRLSAGEKKLLVRELKARAACKLVIEAILMGALMVASKCFADNGLYGLPQIVTLGMTGFAGTLIGAEIYAIKKLPELG